VKYMILVGFIALAGCTILSTRIAPKVAKVVDSYCREPQASRLALRSEINSLTAPNSVQVNCTADSLAPGITQ
jgi:hypothetical protein